MNVFPWRVYEGRTLAYSLDDREVPRLFAEDFILQPHEAALIVHHRKPVETLTPVTLRTGGGLSWVKKFFGRGEDLAVVFVDARPRECVFRFSGVCSDGLELRGALTARVEIIPMKAFSFLGLSGAWRAVADVDLLRVVEERLMEALAPELKRGTLRGFEETEAGVERLADAALAALKETASLYGLRISRPALLWGVTPESQARLAQEALLEIAERNAFDDLRDGLDQRRGLHVLYDQEEALAALRDIEATDRRELKTLYLRAALAGAPPPPPAPEGEEVEPPSPEELAEEMRRRVAFLISEGEKAFGPLRLGVPDEPPDDMVVAPPDEPEPPAQTAPASVDWESLSLEVSGEPAPAPEEPPPAPPGGEALEKPAPARLAETARGALGWRIHGGQTLACRLDDLQIPQLLRPSFSLSPGDTALVARGSHALDVLSRGSERTGGGLHWVRRLFASGGDVAVLLFSTEPFEVCLDLAASTEEGRLVLGELRLELEIPPLKAGALAASLAGKPPLCRPDLAERLRLIAQTDLELELSRASGDRIAYSALEARVAAAVSEELASLGLAARAARFSWGADLESFAALDDAAAGREAAAWRFGIDRRLPEARHALELAKLKVETLTALSRALEAGNEDFTRILLRAAFGREALTALEKPVGREEVAEALTGARREAAERERALPLLEEEAWRDLAEGPPRREPRDASEAPVAPVPLEEQPEPLSSADWLDADAPLFDATMFDAPLFHDPLRLPEIDGHGDRPLDAADLSPLAGVEFAREGALGDADNGAGLAMGGSGARLTVHTRCAYCMAPLKPGWTACGNCGRETR